MMTAILNPYIDFPILPAHVAVLGVRLRESTNTRSNRIQGQRRDPTIRLGGGYDLASLGLHGVQVR